jgi:hypothetical protein
MTSGNGEGSADFDWRRSHKGNFTSHWRGLEGSWVTIYRRGIGYSVSVQQQPRDRRPNYLPEIFATVEEAKEAAYQYACRHWAGDRAA